MKRTVSVKRDWPDASKGEACSHPPHLRGPWVGNVSACHQCGVAIRRRVEMFVVGEVEETIREHE